MNWPNLQEERRLKKEGYFPICLDEAGRGAIAGPVVAAAVGIKKYKGVSIKYKGGSIRYKGVLIRDSKKLSKKKREEFYKVLTKDPNIEWGIGRVSERVIDKINILEATKLAMKRAFKNLNHKTKRGKKLKNFLILDGNFKINLPVPQKTIIKADEKVLSCAIASILAKVTRDRIMERYHKKYPQYEFKKHKGYPTKLHLRLLKKYGPSHIHRKSFGPVKTLKRKTGFGKIKHHGCS